MINFKRENILKVNFVLLQTMSDSPDLDFIYEDADTYAMEIAGKVSSVFTVTISET